MGRRLIGSLAAAALLACFAASATPANALAEDDGALEPPGLDGRETHMTVLTTDESGCTELTIPRAITPEGARALVPERYEPTVAVGGALTTSTFRMWDYVCEHLTVDGQSHAQRTHISIGAVLFSSRDGLPLTGFYLVSLATDNAVLAARYRQVGMPAVFAPGLSDQVSDAADSPFTVSFAVPEPRYDVGATGPSAPIPVPVAAGGPGIFYEGASGEVVLQYRNRTAGTAPGQVTADYREHEILAPIIALPRLLQITGVTFPMIRGDWNATVARLD